MNIQERFREDLILHENELLLEGKLDSMLQKVIEFLKKNVKKIGQGLLKKKDYALKLIGLLRQAGRDFSAGKLNKKKPTFDESAYQSAVNAVKDFAKLLAFFGMNMLLNYFVPLLGAGVGALVMLFRKIAPEKIADFLTLTIEKVKELGSDAEETVKEVLGLLEDMSYWHVGDATQDEFSMGR